MNRKEERTKQETTYFNIGTTDLYLSFKQNFSWT